jgi:hypothetical protein
MNNEMGDGVVFVDRRAGRTVDYKKSLERKTYLIPVSCGAAYFQQAVSDLRRIDSYPASRESALIPFNEPLLPRPTF